MPVSVLQRVERRRRRRSRRPLVVLVLLAAVGAGAWAAVARQRSPERPLAPPGTATPSAVGIRAVPSRPARLRPLLVAGTPLPHRFHPALTAASAILVDASDGRVLWSRRPHVRRPIASTTKIMTAVLALQGLSAHDVVTVDPSVPRSAPFREGLRAGERLPAWKLLYGLLLFSGNDDALALAVATAGSRPAFIAAMNEKARELDLRDSHFRSPSGVVDRGSRSSAWDLAALTRYAMRNPRFRAIVRTRIKRVAWPAPTYAKVYVNKNQLLGRYAGADGVKTGWTTLAGHCLVASAHRGRARLIAVVLRSADPYGDARRLLSLGFRSRPA